MEIKAEKKSTKKQITDAYVKRKAVKLVLAHLKKKVSGNESTRLDSFFTIGWMRWKHCWRRKSLIFVNTTEC